MITTTGYTRNQMKAAPTLLYKLLDEEKEVEEIARLLGGTVITQTTLKSARELIEGIEG